jgi:hypothetical protein
MGSSDPPDGEISIEIPLPPGTASSGPPGGKDHGRLKAWTNFIATAAALLVAAAAILKPQDHSTARASYDELKKAVDENSQNDRRNHEDLVALRNYMDGYLKGAGAATSLPSSMPVPSTSGSARAIPPAPVATMPPLPVLHPEPKPHNLPDFDAVMKK